MNHAQIADPFDSPVASGAASLPGAPHGPNGLHAVAAPVPPNYDSPPRDTDDVSTATHENNKEGPRRLKFYFGKNLSGAFNAADPSNQ